MRSSREERERERKNERQNGTRSKVTIASLAPSCLISRCSEGTVSLSRLSTPLLAVARVEKGNPKTAAFGRETRVPIDIAILHSTTLLFLRNFTYELLAFEYKGRSVFVHTYFHLGTGN